MLQTGLDVLYGQFLVKGECLANQCASCSYDKVAGRLAY